MTQALLTNGTGWVCLPIYVWHNGVLLLWITAVTRALRAQEHKGLREVTLYNSVHRRGCCFNFIWSFCKWCPPKFVALIGYPEAWSVKKLLVWALPCRKCFRNHSPAKYKKSILPKGNGCCQTTSYQIPSRWKLYFEATIYPQGPHYRAEGIYLKGNGNVIHGSLGSIVQLKCEVGFLGGFLMCSLSFHEQ